MTVIRPISELDVSAPALEARTHLAWLQTHPVPAEAPLKDRHDWLAAAFRDLAAAHPELCASDADYPTWIPPHSTPEEGDR